MGALLAVLRVLLNLTHDSELGSHRLGEQEGALTTVLDIVFKVRGGYLLGTVVTSSKYYYMYLMATINLQQGCI